MNRVRIPIALAACGLAVHIAGRSMGRLEVAERCTILAAFIVSAAIGAGLRSLDICEPFPAKKSVGDRILSALPYAAYALVLSPLVFVGLAVATEFFSWWMPLVPRWFLHTAGSLTTGM